MNIHDKDYLIDMLKEAFDELEHLKQEVEDWKKAASNFGCDCPIDLLTKHYWGNEELVQLKQQVEEWNRAADKLGFDSPAELIKAWENYSL